jgi:hypothetical protein
MPLLLVTANVVPSSSILFTLMMEALISPQTWVLKEARGLISEKMVFLHSCCRDSLKADVIYVYILILNCVEQRAMLGGLPCHHSMARPQVADGETASRNVG